MGNPAPQPSIYRWIMFNNKIYSEFVNIDTSQYPPAPNIWW